MASAKLRKIIVLPENNVVNTPVLEMPVNRSQWKRLPEILFFVSWINFASTYLSVPPKDVDAVRGTSVVFNCSSSIHDTDVQWNYYPIGKTMEVIYAYGKIKPEYAERFTVRDKHNLHISPVAVEVAGTYQCIDEFGQGDRLSADLIVMESNPICRNSSNLDKVIGENQCGIEPTQLTLSCIVQYRGNKVPVMEWMEDGKKQPITYGVNGANGGKVFIYNLTLKGDSIANGTSFNCRPTKATSESATCTSGSITIIGKPEPTSDSDRRQLATGSLFVAIFLLICVGVA